jgi:hypothetical protein
MVFSFLLLGNQRKCTGQAKCELQQFKASNLKGCLCKGTLVLITLSTTRRCQKGEIFPAQRKVLPPSTVVKPLSRRRHNIVNREGWFRVNEHEHLARCDED